MLSEFRAALRAAPTLITPGSIYGEQATWLHREVQRSYGISSFWATTVPANTRCQALLLRGGYQQIHEATPVLYSFEEGDLVYHLRGAG